MEPIQLTKSDAEFIRKVEEESGQTMNKCYQCGNCTAGCPMSFSYDFTPSKIMRLIQLGQRDMVLSCKAIWMCATCETCSTRCPNNIEIAQIIDVCRHMARRENKAGVRNVKLFTNSFLDSVNWFGRAYELGLMSFYKMKSARFFDDLLLAPGMILKRKLPFLPHRIKGRKEVAGIFKRYQESLKTDFLLRQEKEFLEEKAQKQKHQSAASGAEQPQEDLGGNHGK